MDLFMMVKANSAYDASTHFTLLRHRFFKIYQLNINESVPLILIFSAFEGQYQGRYDHRRTSQTHRKVSEIAL